MGGDLWAKCRKRQIEDPEYDNRMLSWGTNVDWHYNTICRSVMFVVQQGEAEAGIIGEQCNCALSTYAHSLSLECEVSRVIRMSLTSN